MLFTSMSGCLFWSAMWWSSYRTLLWFITSGTNGRRSELATSIPRAIVALCVSSFGFGYCLYSACFAFQEMR